MLAWRFDIRALAATLADTGWCVVEDALAAENVQALRQHATERQHEFTPAGTGRDAVQSALRNDRTRWIEASSTDPTERAMAAALDALRTDLNEQLYLGAHEVEAHWACYPAGAGYGRHLDRMRHDDARVLSLVLYLNPDWPNEAGGALRLWLDDSNTHDIAPLGGRLVLFRSEQFWHEVLPSTQARYSVAGWFRRRSLG